MKKNDILFGIIFILLLLPFIPISIFVPFQTSFLYNESYWVITSFLKFGFLATLGEVLGLRMKTGSYNAPNFGILPRAIVWGFLGIAIKVAFVVFSVGAPVFLEKSCGLIGAIDAMKSKDIFEAMNKGMGGMRLLAAFSVSVLMNSTFGAVMMTFHKITDAHIAKTGGSIIGLFRPIQFKEIFPAINWRVQWDFVYKKTIPLFWFPAHTITFLLPSEFRVAFAAVLGIALGIILSIAAIKGGK